MTDSEKVLISLFVYVCEKELGLTVSQSEKQSVMNSVRGHGHIDDLVVTSYGCPSQNVSLECEQCEMVIVDSDSLLVARDEVA